MLGGVPSAPPLVEPSKEPTTAMCDYERLRERNIARNKARLVELGLDTFVMKKLPATKKSKVSTSGPLSHPTRRSERISTKEGVSIEPPLGMHSNESDEINDERESSEGEVPSASPLVEQLRTTRGGNSIGRNWYMWTSDDEQHLLIWFNDSHDRNARIDFARIDFARIDFTDISTIIGRTPRACQDKLRVIINSGVLTQDVIDGFIDRFRNYVYTQDVPASMRLESLASADGSIVSFKEWQDEGARGKKRNPQETCQERFFGPKK